MRRPALLVVVLILTLVGAGSTAAAPPAAQADNDTFTAEFEPDTVTRGTNATLLVNTTSDTVAVDSPDLSDEQLHRVVDGRPSGGEVLANVSDGRVTVRFGECAPTGRYQFIVSDSTMRPNANATLEVTAPMDTDPTLTDAVTRVSTGRTARIGIDSDCYRGNATLHVGSRSAGVLANATVNVSRGRNVVRLDTNATDAPDALFAAGPNATLGATTLTSPADPPLPAGEYDLVLSVDGTETDAGALSVSEPANRTTATPTPVVDGTPTLTPADEENETPGTTTTDGQPGFGLVVAIISVILAFYAIFQI